MSAREIDARLRNSERDVPSNSEALLIRAASDSGILKVIVTNGSGDNRGLPTTISPRLPKADKFPASMTLLRHSTFLSVSFLPLLNVYSMFIPLVHS